MQLFSSAILIWVISLACTTSGKLITECCVCDDHSPDLRRRCDVPGICDNSHTYCPEYCLTTRQFIGNKWYTTRHCGLETTCIANWYHTVTELGCIDNTRGEPANGTTCYQCCKLQDPLHPHFCVDNPDTNFVTFPITNTATPTTTTTTTATTTTMQTTTPTTATTSMIKTTTTAMTTTTATAQLTTTPAKLDTTTSTTSVDSGWSAWGNWQGCNVECKGVRLRVLICNTPTPSPTGSPCRGSSVVTENCYPLNCHGSTGSQAIVG